MHHVSQQAIQAELEPLLHFRALRREEEPNTHVARVQAHNRLVLNVTLVPQPDVFAGIPSLAFFDVFFPARERLPSSLRIVQPYRPHELSSLLATNHQVCSPHFDSFLDCYFPHPPCILVKSPSPPLPPRRFFSLSTAHQSDRVLVHPLLHHRLDHVFSPSYSKSSSPEMIGQSTFLHRLLRNLTVYLLQP